MKFINLALVIALALMGSSAHASSVPLFKDQVGDWVVPQAAFQAAARAWGVKIVYGGPPGCLHSPRGVQVICMTALPPSWLGEYLLDGSGIALSPRLIGAPAWEVQEVVEHEIGNALGVPEQPCGARNVMSRCVDGYLNLPRGRTTYDSS